MLAAQGHTVAYRVIVPDDAQGIGAVLDEVLRREDVDVVLTTGGTGITARDSTFEVVSARLEKRLDGFGELFRMLSYADVGPAAMLSRACAGLARGRIVVAMPGSEAAVRLAMEKLLLPEVAHMVREARR
jgi:molybdenum cofactor biosynthesis protein B